MERRHDVNKFMTNAIVVLWNDVVTLIKLSKFNSCIVERLQDDNKVMANTTVVCADKLREIAMDETGSEQYCKQGYFHWLKVGSDFLKSCLTLLRTMRYQSRFSQFVSTICFLFFIMHHSHLYLSARRLTPI